jgi:low affinity Fe/Cu permease
MVMNRHYKNSADLIERTSALDGSDERQGFKGWFEKAATRITRATGSSTAFLLALAVILVWLITGPLFHFSDTWQLVINTGTTIVTFLMVFIIQQSQNKDSLAIQLKLNELIASDEKASNRLIVVEDLTQDELEVLKKFYVKLAQLAKTESDLHNSHSIEEAGDLHELKSSGKKKRATESKIKQDGNS